MRKISAAELVIYGGGSLLYWWLAYVAMRLVPILRCGFGPDAIDDCKAGLLPYLIGFAATVFYAYLAWLVIRDAK